MYRETRSAIARILNAKVWCIRLLQAKPGCVELIFAVPLIAVDQARIALSDVTKTAELLHIIPVLMISIEENGQQTVLYQVSNMHN